MQYTLILRRALMLLTFGLFIYNYAYAITSANLRGVKIHTHPFEQLHSVQSNIAQLAKRQLGKPYRYGGHSPNTGFDCSGLVHYVFAQAAKVTMPRTSAEQSKVGVRIAQNKLQTGDLVFFNTTGKAYSHVGIYLDNGRFIHAARRGVPVNIQSLKQGYWAKRYQGGKRVLLQ